MASRPQLEDTSDFGVDYAGSHSSSKRSGDKRAFGDLEDDEDVVFGSKKGKSKVEESGPGAATGMILSLRESLQNCKHNLATCQDELEATHKEIQKWQAAFRDGPATTAGTTPDPGLVLTYLQNLKSSEESLRDKLEKAKKREAAFIVTYAKREREIADLKSALQDLKKQLLPTSIQKFQNWKIWGWLDLQGLGGLFTCSERIILIFKTRRFLLDPAIHEEFSRLKTLVEEKDNKVKELQDNVAAINFTPSSRMGRELMDKCKQLQEINEEIGARTTEGNIHDLGMEFFSLKSQNTELRNQFDALYQQIDGLNDDVDRSNELVFILQEKLEMKEYEIQRVKDEFRKAKQQLSQTVPEAEPASGEPEPETEPAPEVINELTDNPEAENETEPDDQEAAAEMKSDVEA